MQENGFRQVPLPWAGRVRTGNKQIFDYAKDYEVTYRFNTLLSRERIYKEIKKAKWPLIRVVGMVLRPRSLVDFTLNSKYSALSFAQALNNLDFIRSATEWLRSASTSFTQCFQQNQFRPISNKIMEKLLGPQFE